MSSVCLQTNGLRCISRDLIRNGCCGWLQGVGTSDGCMVGASAVRLASVESLAKAKSECANSYGHCFPGSTGPYEKTADRNWSQGMEAVSGGRKQSNNVDTSTATSREKQNDSNEGANPVQSRAMDHGLAWVESESACTVVLYIRMSSSKPSKTSTCELNETEACPTCFRGQLPR